MTTSASLEKISEYTFKVFDYDFQPRLEERLTLQVVMGSFFSLSILAAITRILIRLRTQKCRRLDDYLLVFACICLTAATALLYSATKEVYFSEAMIIDATWATSVVAADPRGTLQEIGFFRRVNWAYLTLTWTTIFAVKFAFLSFFRRRIDRLPSMHIYWRVVVAFTGLSFLFAICNHFMTCSNLSFSTRE